MSGLKLNDRKTEALWIGSKTNCQQKFCLGKKFQWQNKKVKALGVWFSTDQDMAISLNYTEIPETKFSREDSSFEKSSSISTCICIFAFANKS